jgi:transposase
VVTFEVAMDIEQQLKELEQRRKRGMRLLAADVWPAEVARRVGVSRQSVLRWSKLHAKGGMAALQRPKRFGRPPKLDDAQRAELIKALKAGALAAGFTSELWTLPRIGMLIKERFGVEFSQSSVWRTLQQMGWSVQRPTARIDQEPASGGVPQGPAGDRRPEAADRVGSPAGASLEAG